MERINSYKDLKAWKKSHELVLETYKITKDFPQDEKFGLSSQMRRAAVSVSANIAEGFNRRGVKNKVNFYSISQGSLSELDYYLILAKDLGYCDNSSVALAAEEVGKMLNGLIASIVKSNPIP